MRRWALSQLRLPDNTFSSIAFMVDSSILDMSENLGMWPSKIQNSSTLTFSVSSEKSSGTPGRYEARTIHATS